MVKPSSLQAFAHRPALVRSKCGFENRIKNTFFIRSVSAYRELLIAAVFVVTIVQHRTSVLDKTACVCSKTSRVDHTKSVHNRPKPAVFVRTAHGLSSNQNEVAINSKSGLWRTALLKCIQAAPSINYDTSHLLPSMYVCVRACSHSHVVVVCACVCVCVYAFTSVHCMNVSCACVPCAYSHERACASTYRVRAWSSRVRVHERALH